ncbi:MAG: hypothetical protein NC094_03415 [Bacteroidales bacterium]|nr:hypothetical protein [Lachnoclostridium sp.]MCM1383902.1 hypothetical protein [Lachnoclostridium sp.]MCM1464445.1 hypothetical protein [Bacteroidales bacterium]
MKESSYEEYKRDVARGQKKRDGFRRGSILLVLSIFFVGYLLWILPFRADNVSEVRGNEIEAGKEYYPLKVYYIENLRILHADTDDDEIYCIAQFADCDGKEWLLSFSPGSNERLAEQMKSAGRFSQEPDLTVSGYFQMQYFEDLPFKVDSFYSVYGRKYADAEGGNMLEMNAKYLCDKSGNYTWEALLHPGIPLLTFVVAVFSILFGGYSFIKNRSHRKGV